MRSGNDIRQTFLDYFREAGHEIVASAPLVPQNDPTLMFTNAGMVPFKNVFTGTETRSYSRAASSQKCVRAGGKHNDLDNVGYTARHHTFFEMLGNFSFGDYFKAGAIEYAWKLITGAFGIDREKLLVTVYAEDEEAFALWRKIAGLPEERVVRIATSDNFWSMGDLGPCGPCSEIFYDHGASVAGGPPGSPDADGDRFVEIWNLVFMQYEQIAGGERIPLPKPSIDTGMGLERITAVLQGTHDNYETDLIKTLIDASVSASGVAASGAHRASHRVIADHLRSCGFLIADGVLPANEGRGYVLRRIMRRAMRYAHLLGTKDIHMHRLAPALVSIMGEQYPELRRAEPLIIETLKLEEERFRSMLERGLRLLDDEVGKLSSSQALPGDVAFKLYDTYGFPLDLTQDAMRNQGRTVDVAGFDAAMARQKEAARAAWAGSGEIATEKLWFELRDAFGATEFLGYAQPVAEAQIAAIVKDGVRVGQASVGDDVSILVNQTPFYAESGGQMGDAGVMTSFSARASITDTRKKLGDLHVHLVKVEEGVLKVGDTVDLAIDAARRAALRANHSATHLLHEVLRRVLGEHVTQKGSLVAPDRLRFDFSHPKPLDAAEKDRIEAEVNAAIRANGKVETRIMPPDAARDAGALALFGEKYGDEVRVVSMGGDALRTHGHFSVELCGGTHVRRTGDIGQFRIVSEAAVAAGVRRIEALTGEAARQETAREATLLADAAASVKALPADLPDRIEVLLKERKELQRQLSEARKALALGSGASGGEADIKTINGIPFMALTLSDVAAEDLKGIADEKRKEIGSGIVAIANTVNGKAALLVAATPDLAGKVDAIQLVRAGAVFIGGKGGGGRPDMAQAGGPDPSGAVKALEAIEKALVPKG